jgi:hypothetical membrane protein
MPWNAYEVFSIISGLVLIAAAFVPSLSGKDRVWAFVGGVFMAGYGLWVHQQTDGTYYFSVWIFIIPFAAVIYLAVQAVNARKGDTDQEGH